MQIKNCRVCASENLEIFLDLGSQPWCNNFISEDQVGLEKKYPLELYFCHSCTTVQINHNVPKEEMYSNHLYLSGVTDTMKQHFDQVATRLTDATGINNGLVVDIGSNDGTLLTSYLRRGFDVLGIEPCHEIANLANNTGVNTWHKFFDIDCANQIKDEYGAAKIISAANVFYHLEDLHSVVAGVNNLLDDNGVFVIQGSYLPEIVETLAFDILYHEHLLYYRYETLRKLLRMYDLEVFHIYRADVHGGSIIVYVGKSGRWKQDQTVVAFQNQEKINDYDKYQTYQVFGRAVETLGKRIQHLIQDLNEEGNQIYAYGAPAKGTVLLNYCQLTKDEIPIAVEKNPMKFGRYIPGTGVAIKDENYVDEPDYYLMLPWNFRSEFCSGKEYMNGLRKFILPIPFPRILSN